jgi:hypothetical protein
MCLKFLIVSLLLRYPTLWFLSMSNFPGLNRVYRYKGSLGCYCSDPSSISAIACDTHIDSSSLCQIVTPGCKSLPKTFRTSPIISTRDTLHSSIRHEPAIGFHKETSQYQQMTTLRPQTAATRPQPHCGPQLPRCQAPPVTTRVTLSDHSTGSVRVNPFTHSNCAEPFPICGNETSDHSEKRWKPV